MPPFLCASAVKPGIFAQRDSSCQASAPPLGLLLIAISAAMHTFDLGPVSLPIQRLLIPPCILSAPPWDVRGIKQFARSLFPALLQSIPQQNKKPTSLRSKSSQSTFSSKRLRTTPRALPASHLTSQHSLRTVSGLYSSHSSNTRQVVPPEGPCTCCLVPLECPPLVLFKTFTVQMPRVTF